MRLRRSSSQPNSESGLISVGTVIGLALVAFFIYLALAAFNGDASHYGTVSIPSEKVPIELPKGQTDIYYAESVEGGSDLVLVPPEDLSYAVTTEDNQGVRIDERGGDPESTDDGTARVIGAVNAPEDGTYLVDAESSQLAQRVTPAITFGQSPIEAVTARFDEVIDELNGPTGIVALVALGILFLAPRVGRALDR